MKKYDISTMEQLGELAVELLRNSAASLDQATLITLTGDLGAGKTTLVQTLGMQLGITEAITSPTYVIEQRYDIEAGTFGASPTLPTTNSKIGSGTWTKLIHIDAYRLENPDDPEKIGLPETLSNPENLVIIEWPEKIADFLGSYKKQEVTLVFQNNIRTAKI